MATIGVLRRTFAVHSISIFVAITAGAWSPRVVAAARESQPRMRPATAAAVQANPHYAAWTAALEEAAAAAKASAGGAIASGSEGAIKSGNESARGGNNTTNSANATSTTTAPTCATTDALERQLATASQHRAALLQSLAAQGFAPAPAPPGVAPWPWGLKSAASSPGDTAAPPAPLAPPPAFTAAVVDTNNVSLLHDVGNITFINREYQFEIDPIFAGNAFYAAHDDDYDVLCVFTTFSTQLTGGNFLAYSLSVANDVTGLGYTHIRNNELFDFSNNYTGTAPGDRLQNFLHMNRIGAFPDQPDARYTSQYTPLELLGHEFAHRWLARIYLDVPGSGQIPILLGRQNAHWSFIANSQGSPLEGNTWEPLHVGRSWVSTLLPITYSPLDLYLMGMLAPSEVDHETLFYLNAIENVEPPVDRFGNPWTTWSAPTPDILCDATPVYYRIDDVALANGHRLPAYPQARRDFRLAFALVWQTMAPPTASDLDKLGRLQAQFTTWFHTATRERGTIDTQLTSLPAELVFEHRAHGNVEDTTLPIAIATRIRLEQRSRPTRIEEVSVTLEYATGDGEFTSVPMTAVTAEGDFAATLPAQPLGSTVRYRMRAATALPGHEATWPQDPAAAFTFQVAPDAAGPTVEHAPRTRWSRLAEPPLLRAMVRDAHGIADVRIEFREEGQSTLQSTPMTVQGTSDIWEARPVFPGRLGHKVEYRIVARDVAGTPHETRLPADGFFELRWDRALIEDAEVEDLMWTHRSLLFGRADEWHREVVNPIEGLRSWKVGPTNNIVGGNIARPQDSVLESPAIAIYPGAQLRIRHRYAFLRHPFVIDEAWDGGLVEWQDVVRDGPLGRWYLIDPDGGYPFHIFSYDTDSALRGYPAYSGYQALPVEDTFTFQQWHWNRTVRVRFRVSTTPDALRLSLDGWYLDAIRIDPGPPPTAIALSGLAAERIAGDAGGGGGGASGGVRLTWRASEVVPEDRFRVERAEVDAGGNAGVFAELALVSGVAGQDEYAFVDASPPVGELAYRVGLVGGGGGGGSGGSGDELAALEVRVAMVARFALHPNVPNPFNPSTRIRFELAQAGSVRLDIFDVSGRRVRTLVSAPRLAAGPHEIRWDGRDASGHSAASGIYWARLESDGRSAVQRMALVR